MKRLPIIRHVRWWIWKRRVDEHYRAWADFGYYAHNRKSDDAHLLDIWKGRA